MQARKGPLFYVLAAVLAVVPPVWARQKPFTQDQIGNMVRAGLGDDTGARAISQRGIDFQPSEDFLRSLTAGGASDTFINALRAASSPKSTSTVKPMNRIQVITLLASEIPSKIVAMRVQQYGVDFDVNDEYLQQVRLAGGGDDLVNALKNAKVTKPAALESAAESRWDQLKDHVAKGSEFASKKQYAQAEGEYRAAILLDPQISDLHAELAVLVNLQRKWDEGESAARESLRLDADNVVGHAELSIALRNKGDLDGAIAENREALRLDPNNAVLHNNLAAALERKRDWNGSIQECHEALRLDPTNAVAHQILGSALAGQGDVDGLIREEREAVRLDPDNASAHANQGAGLIKKKDFDGAVAEEHEALRLNPRYAYAHYELGDALWKKGDKQSARDEFGEAATLDPQNAVFQRTYQQVSTRVRQ